MSPVASHCVTTAIMMLFSVSRLYNLIFSCVWYTTYSINDNSGAYVHQYTVIFDQLSELRDCTGLPTCSTTNRKMKPRCIYASYRKMQVVILYQHDDALYATTLLFSSLLRLQ